MNVLLKHLIVDWPYVMETKSGDTQNSTRFNTCVSPSNHFICYTAVNSTYKARSIEGLFSEGIIE